MSSAVGKNIERNVSSPPLSLEINPKPLSALNHFTVPVIKLSPPYILLLFNNKNKQSK